MSSATIEQWWVYSHAARTRRAANKRVKCACSRLRYAGARLLMDEMGVDVIEAGFPIASEGDFAAVSEIARQAQHSVICGLARAQIPDIQAQRPAGMTIGIPYDSTEYIQDAIDEVLTTREAVRYRRPARRALYLPARRADAAQRVRCEVAGRRQLSLMVARERQRRAVRGERRTRRAIVRRHRRAARRPAGR